MPGLFPSPSSMALQTENPAAAPPAQLVGEAFVEQYYHILHHSPELVHRFYLDSSALSRPDCSGAMISVTSKQNIHEMIMSSEYKHYKAEIKTADALKSYKDGVTVLVTGCLTGKDNLRRKFAQSFFLAPQDNGYFALNDVFRYVEDDEPLDDHAVKGVDNVAAVPLTPDRELIHISDPPATNPETSTVEEDQNVVEKSHDPSQHERQLATEKEAIPQLKSHSNGNDVSIAVEPSSSSGKDDAPRKSNASIVKVTRGSSEQTKVFRAPENLSLGLAVPNSVPEASAPSSVGTPRIFCPRTYEIAVFMPIWNQGGMLWRWYVFAIGVDAGGMVTSEERPIKPFLEEAGSPYSSFEALGFTLYCFGRGFDVFKREVNGPTTDDWIRCPSMNIPRGRPHKLVLGSKLYVLGTDFRSKVFYAEVFDPVTNKWLVLPQPPYKMARGFKISAALENPNRILVTSQVPPVPGDYSGNISAIFFVYDVGHGYWKMLEPAQRKIHPKCPLGAPRGTARAVANFLYWITDGCELLCYDLDLDVWLLGHLDGILFPEYCIFNPGFVHLENHRFCILQCPPVSGVGLYVHCNIIDVTHIHEEESLGVSVVWSCKFKTEDPTNITECFLLGK